MDAQELLTLIAGNGNISRGNRVDVWESRDIFALVTNIVNYVDAQGFVDVEDSHRHLKSLLGGVISDDIILMYETANCEVCGSHFLPYDGQEFNVCSECFYSGGG